MKSITVKVKFLGIIYCVTNTKSVIVNLNDPFTIERLINSLEGQFTSLPGTIRDFDGNFVIYFIVVVNGRVYRTPDFGQKLEDGDEVTFMFMEVGG